MTTSTVTLSNGGTVTIVAGQTQAIYTAPIQGEDVFKDGGPLNLKVTDATVTGKAFENLVLSDTAGTGANQRHPQRSRRQADRG